MMEGESYQEESEGIIMISNLYEIKIKKYWVHNYLSLLFIMCLVIGRDQLHELH